MSVLGFTNICSNRSTAAANLVGNDRFFFGAQRFYEFDNGNSKIHGQMRELIVTHNRITSKGNITYNSNSCNEAFGKPNMKRQQAAMKHRIYMRYEAKRRNIMHPQGALHGRRPLHFSWRVSDASFRRVSGVLKPTDKQNKKHTVWCAFYFGDPSGIRTPDTLLKREMLCQLS